MRRWGLHSCKGSAFDDCFYNCLHRRRHFVFDLSGFRERIDSQYWIWFVFFLFVCFAFLFNNPWFLKLRQSEISLFRDYSTASPAIISWTKFLAVLLLTCFQQMVLPVLSQSSLFVKRPHLNPSLKKANINSVSIMAAVNIHHWLLKKRHDSVWLITHIVEMT